MFTVGIDTGAKVARKELVDEFFDRAAARSKGILYLQTINIRAGDEKVKLQTILLI